MNYNEKLENLEKTLNIWKMCDLSLMGRNLIVKSLGISQLFTLQHNRNK